MSEEINIEYRFLNLSIEIIGLLYGTFLIIWGICVSIVSESNSFTSYIPAFLGLPIFFFCYLSIKYHKLKKALMHIVVLIALLIFLGGLDFLREIFSVNTQVNFYASASKLMMLLTGTLYLYLCICSFRFNKNIKK